MPPSSPTSSSRQISVAAALALCVNNNSGKHFRYWLTQLNRVLSEMLISLLEVKNFPEIYGICKFTTTFTSTSHLSLSRARSIQSMPTHPTFWRSILLFPFHLLLDLPSGFFHWSLSTKTLYAPLLSPYAPHAPSISFFLISTPEQYLVRSRVHEAPRYVVFTRLLRLGWNSVYFF
jgi:hypothetical protein